MQGLVLKSTGSWYKVQTKENHVYDCRILGKFRIKGIKSTNPLAVGDYVDFELEPEKKTGIITKIQERKNYLIRKSVNLSKQKHIIAANIDYAFLLITIDYPKTYTAFIDRFLVTTEAYRIHTILVFNKIDLYDDELLSQKDKLKKIYESVGYTCLEVSAINLQNIEPIKQLIHNKISLFIGNSGVGKSTLINAIQPKLELNTRSISEVHLQGQHTTTFAQMYPLDFGGYIIDTPGIRGFGLYDFTKDEMSHFFPEIFKLQSHCKFHNCSHIIEPKCAVINAVNNGDIAKSRYINYISLLEDDEIYR